MTNDAFEYPTRIHVKHILLLFSTNLMTLGSNLRLVTGSGQFSDE